MWNNSQSYNHVQQTTCLRVLLAEALLQGHVVVSPHTDGLIGEKSLGCVMDRLLAFRLYAHPHVWRLWLAPPLQPVRPTALPQAL